MGIFEASVSGRLEQPVSPFGVVDSSPVGHEAVGGHHEEEVLEDALDGDAHVTVQQGLDDPIRVPVIELAEATCSHRIS